MIKIFRKLRAKINRTFVADCPKCHKHFYGFHAHGKSVKVGKIMYRILCHRCMESVK